MQFFVKKDTKKYILKYRSRCSKGIEIWTMKKKKRYLLFVPSERLRGKKEILPENVQIKERKKENAKNNF